MILDSGRLKPTHKIACSSKPALKHSGLDRMPQILPAARDVGLVEEFTKALCIMFSDLTNAPATDEAMPNFHADIIPWPSLMSKLAVA